jgi:hypothetical protein
MGVVPGIFLKPMEPSVLRVIDRINGVQVTQAPRRPDHQVGQVTQAPRRPDLQVGRVRISNPGGSVTPDLKVGPTGGGGR